MGKNQAYKAMQRAKMSSHTAAGGPDEVDDGMMDGSFHSPEWHAARLASLQTSHTVTWEEWKQKQKDEAKRQGELEDDEARLMVEYRAQLDAERAQKLARGKNHADKRKEPRKEKEKKEKEKSHSKKRKKSSKSRSGKTDLDSGFDSSNSDEYDHNIRTSKKDKKHKKHKVRGKWSSSPSSDTRHNEAKRTDTSFGYTDRYK